MNRHALDVLEFAAICERLAERTSFSASRELALGLTPVAQASTVYLLQAETVEARRLLERTPPRLAGAHDVREEAQHAGHGGVLGEAALAAIAETCTTALGVRASIAAEYDDARLLSTHTEAITDGLATVAERITRAIDLDDAQLRDSASPRLKTLRSELVRVRRRASERLRQLASSAELAPHLQEEFVTERNGRPVLAVKASSRGAVRGIVHDSSGSGQTVFIEPFELVELSNEQRELEGDERDEVQRILIELSSVVGGQADDLVASVEALAVIDLAFARAELSRSWNGVAAEISGHIALVGARHPLLDPARVVGIDLDLEDVRTVVLSGPNTGGKTVALKTLALCVLLHQAGLQVPAERAVLPIVADVLADIGDEQSIERSLSTFSGHVRNLVEILEVADGGTIVLLDEIAAGTDPVEGAALARAVLEALSSRALLTVTTTHYPEVKAWASSSKSARNAAVGFDPETLEPTYEIVLGRPGPSHALAIAQRLGLDSAIVDAALEHIAPERIETERLLAEAASAERSAAALRDDASLLREQAAAARRAAERERDRQQAAADAAEQAVAHERERARAEALTALAAQRGELDALRGEIRAARKAERGRAQATNERARQSESERDRRLTNADERVRAAATKAEQAIELPLATRIPLAAGDPVRSRELGVRGVILEVSGETALVQGGTLRVHVPLAQLEPDPGAHTEVRREQPVTVRMTVTADVESQIDLRGKTSDEARIAVRQLVDNASMAGLAEVHVIHGRGTGAVRAAVRAELDRHPLVERYESQSLDGATRVLLPGSGA